jgi:predicted RNA-binding Zn ribbon-like protein
MPPEEFILLGDTLWLDFVNTARGRTADPPDRLSDPDAWARWSSLQNVDRTSPVPFADVLEFRARLTDLAEALHGGRPTASGVIAALNEQLGRSAGRQQLTRVSGDWRLRFAPFRPAAALEAIARSAAETLADPRMAVRCCSAASCSLFFTDDSPNASRRWCDAALCGQHGVVERRRGSGARR